MSDSKTGGSEQGFEGTTLSNGPTQRPLTVLREMYRLLRSGD